MSYSNALLESTSTKIIEGIPGVGFKLTENGNYDMENKKLTNLKPGSDDSDALTKKQIFDHINTNGGDSSSPSIDLTDYLKKDGSIGLTGHWQMNYNQIEDIGNPRDGKSDPIPYQYFSQWYMKFDDDNIKIDVKNPIKMGNKKITNLKEGIENNDAITKHQLQTGLAPKADKTELNNYILKSCLTSNLDIRYLRRDQTTIDCENNRISRVFPPLNLLDAAPKQYVDQNVSKSSIQKTVIFQEGVILLQGII